ncbi:MAG: pseudouridine synthase [Candidatus Thiodiazotropha sp. (ex Monitilora ramsayi)]|nr:pseudouridine synthase [Candidatus Thiodiazotropha sp. (ex Monitilora ramsayi)]
MRLDRFLSNATTLSRSQAQRMIRAGRVCVGGAEVKQAATLIPLTSEVVLDGERIEPPLPRYLMLHKPRGVVCATEDPTHRTAIDLLGLPSPAGLHFAGRLDIDATGLVLITDDGQWSHRIVSPGSHCAKRYRVWLADPLTDRHLMQLMGGVVLRGEKRPTRPAEAERLSDRECLLTISEGRYHQVKRMFAALGNRVIRLHRESIGPLSLDAELGAGSFRPLTSDEVAFF